MSDNDCQEIDYSAFEEVFPAFWEANIKNNYSCFDFDQAFNETRRIWFDYEVGHRGGLGFKEWFEYLEADHMHTDPKLGGSILFADKVGLTDEEAWELLHTDRQKLMDMYRPIFEDEYISQKDDPLMKELVKTRLMMMRPPEDLSSNILLMDRVINAVHLGGWSIYPGFDVDSFREKVEREFRSKKKNPNNPCPKIDYTDNKAWISAFWEANIKQDYLCFDFNRVRSQIISVLKRYIEDTTLIDKEFFAEESKLFVGEVTYQIPEATKEAEVFYDKFIEEWYGMNTADKVLLIDDLIHHQHMSGSYMRGDGGSYIDIDDLREEFEKKLPKESNPKEPCPEINYYDPEEVFPAFWEGNIKRDYGCFDFDRAFGELLMPLYDKLAEHGMLGRDNCVEYKTEMWYPMDILGEHLEYFMVDNPFIQVTKEEVLEAIMNLHCKRYEDEFGDDPTFMDLKKTYEMMKFPPEEEKEKAILMDRVIDAAHQTGSIWDDMVDVEDLRAEFEKKYTEKVNSMKEACKQRVDEGLEIIKKAEKGDKTACIPRDGARKFVGCLGAHNREKGMEFGESMKKAWETYNKHKCAPKEG